jgi:hypothetical protein
MLNNLKYYSTVKVTVSALNKYSTTGLVFTGIATLVWFNDSVLVLRLCGIMYLKQWPSCCSGLVSQLG